MITIPEIKTIICEFFTTDSTIAEIEEFEITPNAYNIVLNFTLQVLEEIPPTPPMLFVVDYVLQNQHTLQQTLSNHGVTFLIQKAGLKSVVLDENVRSQRDARWLATFECVANYPSY